MPETSDTAAEVQEIRFRLEAIEATQTLLVRERATSLLDIYLALFREHEGLAAVYFAIDGTRTQAEVVDALKARNIDMSQPTVSRRMQVLLENGLIEEVPTSKAGKVFAKNSQVERILRLSKRLS